MPEPVTHQNLSETISLLGRAREGDKRAADDLYARLGPRLQAVVRLRLGNRLRSKMESMDVVQDALLAALPHAQEKQFESGGALFHWLTKHVENRIRDMADHFGAQKRDAARERPLEAAGPSCDSVFGPIAGLATFATPSQILIGKEELARFEAAIDALPDDQKEAFIMSRYEEMAWEEIGRAMNRTPDAARMLASRAMVQLRKTLGATTGTA